MAEPLNICVVDDDRDVAEGLAEILELAGHQVRTAFTGHEALGILDTADCDIAFINATLPDMSTLESFMAIRKARPGLKTVMMTGYTVEHLLKQTVQDGSVCVLHKPVAMDEVLRGLESIKPKGIVLVADDDPQIGAKISETLRLQDHRVGIARTAGDALDMVVVDACDTLVLDLHLPVITALEVYLDLQGQDLALPTIVISGVPDREKGQIDLLRNPAVTGVLVKPFDPARLLATLETVQRPANRPPAEKRVEKTAQRAAAEGRILVIDDDRDLAEGLGDILTDLGHTVEIAFTGAEALEIARRFDAQIALVDIKLGRTSGLELIGKLKELRPGIVNVVITANAGKESVIASLRSGAFDFLNKPMHPQDLFVIIDRCFEQIRAQQAQAGAAGGPAPDFVANVSHELRDPLNAVIGFSEILGDEMLGPLGSEQYVHYARGINQAGHHLTTVIDDMIDQKSPAAERPQAGQPKEDDPQDASIRDDTAEPVPDDPRTAGTGPEQPRALDSKPDRPVADREADLAPDRGESSFDHTWTDALQPGPQGGGVNVRPPDAAFAQPGPIRPQPAEARPDSAPSTPAETIDAEPAAPLLSGTIWDPDMAEPTPAEAEQPEPVWPEPGRTRPPGTEPSRFHAADPAPAEPGWSEPEWTEPYTAESPPVEHDTPETGWDEPPRDDLAVGPPASGRPAGSGRAVEQDEDQEDEEDAAHEARDPAREDEAQESAVEKILRFSPFRKVI